MRRPPDKPRAVLVIVDDERIRWIVATTLRREGLEVTEAGSGEERLQRLAEQPHDIILLDLMLPGGTASGVQGDPPGPHHPAHTAGGVQVRRGRFAARASGGGGGASSTDMRCRVTPKIFAILPWVRPSVCS